MDGSQTPTAQDQALVRLEWLDDGAIVIVTRTLRLWHEIIQPVLEDDARHQAQSYASTEFKECIAVYLPEFYEHQNGPGSQP